MRPGNYAHEEWDRVSAEIGGIKMHMRNKYLRIHKPSQGKYNRQIIITRAQAQLYDALLELPRNEKNHIDIMQLPSNKLNMSSLTALIKRGIFELEDNHVVLV